MSDFESRYTEAVSPPWETGRPQPEFVALSEAGALEGRVLDVGCGTGENAIYLAARGHEVVGLDGAASAIEKARTNAAERGLKGEFVVGDALELEPGSLGGQFDTIIDSGLFHVFDDDDRVRYVANLAGALRPGGSYHMVCFSELEPPGWGPRRVTREEIREAFLADDWKIKEILEAGFETNMREEQVKAWRTWVMRT